MFFWLKFAFKSALGRRKRTLIIFTGLSLAVILLTVLGSLMTGVNDRMVENSVSLYTGHVSGDGGPFSPGDAVKAAAAVAGPEQEGLVAALPRFLFPILLKEGKNTAPIMINAIYPEREKGVSSFSSLVTEGHWFDGSGGLVVGRKTADHLHLKPGDRVTVAAYGKISSREITGIFDTGIDSFDSETAFIDERFMGELTRSEVNCSIAYFLEHDDAAAFAKHMNEQFADSPFHFTTWEEKLPEVAQLVKLNRISMSLVVFLVILIFAFGIANTLVVSLVDRYREFSILKAVGVRPGELVFSIVGESLFVCLAAGIIGTAAGFLVTALLHRVGIDLSAYTSSNPHFSVNSLIRPRFTLYWAVVPQSLALLSGVLASLWPALRIAREEVVTHLRDL